MRIVMMGTGGFAVPVFRWLLDSSHELPALITRPPKPVRGNRQPPRNPMREVAEAAGLSILMPESINDPQAQLQLKALNAELLIVCDYGQILSSSTLGLAPLGGINLHASLLPQYRGAAPINWAIYDGQQETGVTVIHMTAKLDAGPALVQHRTEIAPSENAIELEERLADLGVEAVAESLQVLESWDRNSLLGELQDPRAATRAPRLKKLDGRVDWSRTAQQIGDQVRAFTPWPGTYTHWLRGAGKAQRLLLGEVAVVSSTGPEVSLPQDGPPGHVVSTDGHLCVATGDGVLSLLAIQPAGKRSMDVQTLLRGYPIRVGEIMGDPD